MKPIFFLCHFNDIDHMTPVIWKCLQKNHEVSIVMLNPAYPYKEDPRLQFLLKDSRVKIYFIQDILTPRIFFWIYYLGENRILKWFAQKTRSVFYRLGISKKRAIEFLKEINPTICIFEWGGWASRNRFEFFKAAETLKIKKASLPHGLQVFLNLDVNPLLKEVVKEGKQIRRGKNDVYDVLVYQSHFHKDQEVGIGIREEVTRVMGSARFCPEWYHVQKELYTPYETKNDSKDLLKVCFMLPHWSYFVDQKGTLELIERITRKDNIYLVVKDHTRDKVKFPTEVQERLKNQTNFEKTSTVPSVSLIQWADVTISFSTSIGLEVLLEEKNLINPTYLDKNDTIFESTGSCLEAKSPEEVLGYLDAIYKNRESLIPKKNKEVLFQEVVYGGEKPFDVLEEYYSLLKN